MYPGRELSQLAAQKAAIRERIWLRRIECYEAAGRVAKPLQWLDRMLALWRRLSPFAQFAAVPIGLFLHRAIFPRRRILRSLIRWGPIAFGIVRSVSSAMRANPEAVGSSADTD
jgi:hypothetical protein